MKRQPLSLAAHCLAGLLLAVSPPIWADSDEEAMTADEVLDRHIDARGGLDAWNAIEDLTLEGTYTSFSKLAPFTIHHRRDGKIRLESRMNDHHFVLAHDGSVFWGEGWPFDPEWASRLGTQDTIAFRQESELPSALFNARDHGFEVVLIGPTEVDGIEAIGVELTRQDGEKETWYLDPQSYLEVARDSNGSDFGRPMPQRYFYDDFREVSGVMIPHFVEGQWYTRHRILEVESVEVNTKLDSSLFDFPPPTGMEEFVGTDGEWSVVFESRSNPNAEFEVTDLTSQVEGLARGAMILERITEPNGVQVVYTLNYDRFGEEYLLTSLNDATTNLNLFRGTFDEEGRLVVTDLETGTAQERGGTTLHQRHTFTPLEKGFQAEIEMSRDGGENWMLLEKRTYSRP